MKIRKKILKNFSVLGNINFLLLFQGSLVSNLGSRIYYVGLTWYILDAFDSAMVLGTLLTISSLPGIIFGPIAGVLVDKLDRKKIIVGMDLVRGVVIIIMGYMLQIDLLNFYGLAIGSFLISVSDSLFDPAVSAMIPNIVDKDELGKANSLKRLMNSIITVSGLALGGVLIGAVGILGIFYLNGISYILSAISELFINVKKLEKKSIDLEKEKNKLVSFLNDLVEGFKVITAKKILLLITFVAVIINLVFSGTIAVFLPYIIKEVLGLGEGKFGLIQSFFPIGSIAGALFLTLIPQIKSYYCLTVIGVGFSGLILFFFGIIVIPAVMTVTQGATFLIIVGIMFMIGLASVALNVPVVTLFQKLVEDEYRGRFFAIFGTLSQGLVPMSYLIAGMVLKAFPPFIFMLVGGLMVMSLALLMVLQKNDNELKEEVAV